MILLRELVTDEVQIISEAVSAGSADRSYFIEGPFLMGDIANKNRRRYTMDVLRPEVERYVREHVNQKRAFGELGHPAGPTINMDRVSHIIQSLKEDGSNFIGRAKITTKTPMGAIVKALIDEGAKLGVSSRGVGTLKESGGGISEVQRDFCLATAADIVADPSAPEAFVRGIMENKEWMMVEGVWTEVQQTQAKQMIARTDRRHLEEAQFKIFSAFLNGLARK